MIAPVFMILVVLTQEQGLPVSFPLARREPLTPPAAGTLDKSPLGSWMCGLEVPDASRSEEQREEEPVLLVIALDSKDLTRYAVTIAPPESHEATRVKARPAHVSRAGSLAVLNIDLGPSEEHATNYWFARYRMAAGKLVLQFVGDDAGLPEGPSEAWSVLQERADDPSMYVMSVSCRREHR